MSTASNPSATPSATPATGLDRFYQGASTAEVKQKPQRAVSFKVVSLDDGKQTGGGTGDFHMCKIGIVPTRGSASFFPSLMFRPEMFSPGFLGADYVNYTKYPTLEQINPNSTANPPGTKGAGWRFVYERNVVPGVKRNANTGAPQLFKKGPNAGQPITTGPSMLQMCCGGSLEQLGNLLSAIDSSGYTGAAPSEEIIIGEIRKFIKANEGVEHAAVLRQQNDKNGDLSDNFELNYYLGALTSEVYDDLEARRDSTADDVNVGKRLTISFKV